MVIRNQNFQLYSLLDLQGDMPVDAALMSFIAGIMVCDKQKIIIANPKTFSTFKEATGLEPDYQCRRVNRVIGTAKLG